MSSSDEMPGDVMDSPVKPRSSMTREERKIQAYMRSFALMEKRKKREREKDANNSDDDTSNRVSTAVIASSDRKSEKKSKKKKLKREKEKLKEKLKENARLEKKERKKKRERERREREKEKEKRKQDKRDLEDKKIRRGSAVRRVNSLVKKVVKKIIGKDKKEKKEKTVKQKKLSYTEKASISSSLRNSPSSMNIKKKNSPSIKRKTPKKSRDVNRRISLGPTKSTVPKGDGVSGVEVNESKSKDSTEKFNNEIENKNTTKTVSLNSPEINSKKSNKKDKNSVSSSSINTSTVKTQPTTIVKKKKKKFKMRKKTSSANILTPPTKSAVTMESTTKSTSLVESTTVESTTNEINIDMDSTQKQSILTEKETISEKNEKPKKKRKTPMMKKKPSVILSTPLKSTDVDLTEDNAIDNSIQTPILTPKEKIKKSAKKSSKKTRKKKTKVSKIEIDLLDAKSTASTSELDEESIAQAKLDRIAERKNEEIVKAFQSAKSVHLLDSCFPPHFNGINSMKHSSFLKKQRWRYRVSLCLRREISSMLKAAEVILASNKLASQTALKDLLPVIKSSESICKKENIATCRSALAISPYGQDLDKMGISCDVFRIDVIEPPIKRQMLEHIEHRLTDNLNENEVGDENKSSVKEIGDIFYSSKVSSPVKRNKFSPHTVTRLRTDSISFDKRKRSLSTTSIAEALGPDDEMFQEIRREREQRRERERKREAKKRRMAMNKPLPYIPTPLPARNLSDSSLGFNNNERDTSRDWRNRTNNVNDRNWDQWGGQRERNRQERYSGFRSHQPFDNSNRTMSSSNTVGRSRSPPPPSMRGSMTSPRISSGSSSNLRRMDNNNFHSRPTMRLGGSAGINHNPNQMSGRRRGNDFGSRSMNSRREFPQNTSINSNPTGNTNKSSSRWDAPFVSSTRFSNERTGGGGGGGSRDWHPRDNRRVSNSTSGTHNSNRTRFSNERMGGGGGGGSRDWHSRDNRRVSNSTSGTHNSNRPGKRPFPGGGNLSGRFPPKKQRFKI